MVVLFWALMAVALALGFQWGWRVMIMAGVVTAFGAGVALSTPWSALISLLVLLPMLVVLWPPITDALLRSRLRNIPVLRISDTEQLALQSGSAGFEVGLMQGRPDWSSWFVPAPSLSVDEQRFLDGPVTQLCDLASEWDMTLAKGTNEVIPDSMWALIREHKFFGMIIPKEYGGLGFSAYAHHRVLTKIAGVSGTLASMIGVPNSLGPAELLLRHGTDAQRQQHLPRLAAAQDIPCFGLTSIWAGSDAAAIRDEGVVGYANGPGTPLGLWITCSKRYITLAPIATLFGVAFHAKDPQGLLGMDPDLGVTLALVPRSTPGVVVDHRHAPMDTALINGPFHGRFFIPMDAIIGGQEGLGRGWSMLMECLSVGRAVTLPSVSTGSAIMASVTTGAYIQIRHQFNQPLINFEGIQQRWLEMMSNTITIKALAASTALSVDQGEQPMVGSAVAKYQTTSRARDVITHAVDLHGGKAIQAGPSNYLALPYQGAPISITVEGANILTQSLMVYAPALLKAHPHLATTMAALSKTDAGERLSSLQTQISAHVRYAMGVAWHAWTQTWSAPVELHEEHDVLPAIERYAAALAWVGEMSILVYGADLKKREAQSARLADTLSCLWGAAAVLRQYRWEARQAGDEALVRYTCGELLAQAHEHLHQAMAQLPSPWNGLSRLITRLGPERPYRWSDRQCSMLAKEVSHGPRLRLSSMLAWPAHSPSTLVHQASLDKTFLNALAQPPLSEAHAALLEEVLNVDAFPSSLHPPA